MRFGPKAALGVAALTGVLALGTSAHAYLATFTVDANAKCKSAKIKTSGKGVAGYTGCYAKGASKAVATDITCLSKISTKNTSAFAKLDSKPPCATTGDGAARDTDSANYAASVDTAIGHGAAGAGKCDAAKQKLVGKYVAAIDGCYAKAAAKAPGTVSNGPGSCTDKALTKLTAGIDKAELKPPCTTMGPSPKAGLVAAADGFTQGQACALAPGNPGCPVGPPCGNGVLDLGEQCDPAGGSPTSCAAVSNTGLAFTCSPTCTCACPTKVTFTGDPSDPASLLDTGWRGFGHRAPIISNGAASVGLNSCTGSSRPCGTCNILGPIANPNAGAGQIDNRRCTNDTSIHCTTDAPCTGGGGTCQWYFGSTLPLAAGGVTTCVLNQFNGPVTGTANVETGQGTTTSLLTSKVFLGPIIDNPCPRCIGDTTINDNVKGGTCNGGDRNTLTCDGNGTVFNRPDFGTTSLDCPPSAGALIATLPIDLSSKTAPVTKTLSLSNPTCGADTNQRCLCDTCNNAAAETCDDNGDCPDPAGPIGAICGGKRCVGGTNNGAACNAIRQCAGGSNNFGSCTVAGGASQCPGGGVCNVFCTVLCSGGPNVGNPCTNDSECPGVIPATEGCPTLLCGRKGDASLPSACTDSTTTPDTLDCTEITPGLGEGTCDFGPLTGNCTIASGHAQRGCSGDPECGGVPGTCAFDNRKCFLTGDIPGAGGGPDGTGSLVAAGMADLPTNDSSTPTLGAVFCVGVTSSDAVNGAAGLPGPGRVTIRGQAVGLP